MNLVFKAWRRFHAEKDGRARYALLDDVGRQSVKVFKSSMGNYPPASSPGEYPAKRSGRLFRSVDYDVKGAVNEVTVGSDMPYSRFLRSGTRKMARRKMSDDALMEGTEAALKDVRRPFARWRLG